MLPSTNNSVPEMSLRSSDARNTTAFAISSDVPSLPSGTLLESIFLRCWPVSEGGCNSLNPGAVFQGGNDEDPLADADGIDSGAHDDDSTDTRGPQRGGQGGRTP